MDSFAFSGNSNPGQQIIADIYTKGKMTHYGMQRISKEESLSTRGRSPEQEDRKEGVEKDCIDGSEKGAGRCKLLFIVSSSKAEPAPDFLGAG